MDGIKACRCLVVQYVERRRAVHLAVVWYMLQ